VSNAPSKPVSFSRPKVGYFSNRPRTYIIIAKHAQHNNRKLKTKLKGNTAHNLLEQPWAWNRFHSGMQHSGGSTVAEQVIRNPRLEYF